MDVKRSFYYKAVTQDGEPGYEERFRRNRELVTKRKRHIQTIGQRSPTLAGIIERVYEKMGKLDDLD